MRRDIIRRRAEGRKPRGERGEREERGERVRENQNVFLSQRESGES